MVRSKSKWGGLLLPILMTLLNSSNSMAQDTCATMPPITGQTNFCMATSVTLAHSTAGGKWESEKQGVATIDSFTGVVYGYAAGTAKIYYTARGCSVNTTLTVNPLPGLITGKTTFPVNGSTKVACTTPGGTWSSSSVSVANIGSTSGVITSSKTGSAMITYTTPNTCYRNTKVTSY